MNARIMPMIAARCLFALGALPANAAVECSGKVYKVYKPSGAATLSVTMIMNDGAVTNWVSMPSKSEEAMALMAFASDKPIRFYWTAGDVTACPNGWAQNRVLEGWLTID